jgi:pilus assembly protein CpaD
MNSALDLIRRSAGVAVIALLAGCTDSDPGLIPYAEWQQMDPPPRLQVRDAPVGHAVNFEPGATELSGTESGAVAGFLAAEGVDPGERIMLEAPSAGATDTDRIARRMGALRRMLEDQGISVAVAPPAAPGALGPDQIRLVAMRATAVDPDCPGYNEPVTSYDRFGRPNLAIGCSNEINLGLMVADPNDLVRGRPLAPADAERSALAVQKYRTGSDGDEEGQGGASTMSILPLAIGSGTGGGTQ